MFQIILFHTKYQEWDISYIFSMINNRFISFLCHASEKYYICTFVIGYNHMFLFGGSLALASSLCFSVSVVSEDGECKLD